MGLDDLVEEGKEFVEKLLGHDDAEGDAEATDAPAAAADAAADAPAPAADVAADAPAPAADAGADAPAPAAQDAETPAS